MGRKIKIRRMVLVVCWPLLNSSSSEELFGETKEGEKKDQNPANRVPNIAKIPSVLVFLSLKRDLGPILFDSNALRY